MKSLCLLVLCLITIEGASGQTSREPYIDPTIRLLLRSEARRATDAAPALRPDLSPEIRTIAGRAAVTRRAATGETRISTFMRVRDEQALARLRALGGEVGSFRDGIATVDLPLSAIERLDAASGVVTVEAAQLLTVNHDSSMRAIKVNDVRTLSAGQWTGSTGRNVIVAIYDTGIDFTHFDFRGSNGQTRLLALWDQTTTGTPPVGFLNGHLCSSTAIQQVIDNPTNNTLCRQTDTNGHGSHTAGSAAGDGSATGNGGTAFQYAGVAPNADLIIVKGGNGSFSETSILDGLRWLEQESRLRGRPLVVNLSLGGQFGAHDGSRLYEQGIDGLSRGGFIVVISSGNEGSNNNVVNRDGSPSVPNPFYIHGTGTATTGTARDFVFNVPAYNAVPPTCNEGVGFSLWYESQDRLRITVIRPDGTSHSADTGESTNADSPRGNISIDNAARGASPENGDREAVVQVNDCGPAGGAPMPGTYTMRVSSIGTGSGQAYHFWMVQNFLGGAFAVGGAGFDNRYIVGSPGNAKTAITVGAFTTRVCWPAQTAAQVCFTQVEQIGDIARFSSGGPTRDGRLKPEIVAPGIGIISALSRNASIPPNRIVPSGSHWVNQGTSMAAPHVAGAIALMLEVKPTATADEIRQVFARTAARDGFTSRTYSTGPGTQPSDWWGYGKLDVPAALCGLGGGLSSFVRVTPALDSLPQNATVKLDACATGAAVVFTSSNPTVATVDATGTVRALQQGITLIIARAGTAADTTLITVVAPSTITASGSSVAPAERTLSSRAAQLPLLRVALRVNGIEAVRIESMTFVLTGEDPAAKLVVVQDLNRNGQIENTDRVLASVARPNRGLTDTVRVALEGFTIPARDSVALVAGIELSGGAPNNSQFSLALVTQELRTVGARSGVRDRIDPVTVAIASAAATTTVLERGVAFSMSENPIRSRRVVFNFTEPPTTAAIYTLTGRRVRDLKRAIDHAGRVEWNLENEDGTVIAPGVYLLVFETGGTLIREKLFVLTPRN